MDDKQLSFGEKAVGLNFNPSNNKDVQTIKEDFAKIVDALNDMRNDAEDGEVKRMCAVAITEAQTAQMWAVKAATWGK